MQTLSRRALANYAADNLISGKSQVDIAKRLAAVLIATKRTSQINQLAEDVAYELESRGIVASANVETAHKLDKDMVNLIEKFIVKQTNVKSVVVNANIDESLIGGVAIETARYRWDQTLKRKLTDIREAF